MKEFWVDFYSQALSEAIASEADQSTIEMKM
jgi:hypothetical protein